MRFLRFAAFTHADRHVITDACSKAVGTAGGWINDATLYSNKAATLLFTVPAGGVARLEAELRALDMRLETGDLGGTVEGLPPDAEVRGTLALTFIHTEPDLRREIPAVPG